VKRKVTRVSRNKIEITITYQLSRSSGEESRVLTPEQYYEHAGSEAVAIDSVPRHAHAYQYLGVLKSDLNYTRVRVRNGREWIDVFETFWNHGNNFLVETERRLRNEELYELIIQSKISEEPPTYEIMRFERRNGHLRPIFHVVDFEEATGVREEKVFPASI